MKSLSIRWKSLVVLYRNLPNRKKWFIHHCHLYPPRGDPETRQYVIKPSLAHSTSNMGEMCGAVSKQTPGIPNYIIIKGADATTSVLVLVFCSSFLLLLAPKNIIMSFLLAFTDNFFKARKAQSNLKWLLLYNNDNLSLSLIILRIVNIGQSLGGKKHDQMNYLLCHFLTIFKKCTQLE